MQPQVFTHARMSSDEVTAHLTDSGFDIGPPSTVRRTVLDTFDGRLAAAGMRLELREGDHWELVLTDDASLPAHLAVTDVPSSAASLPAGPIRARLGPVLGVRALLPFVSVTARRLVAVRRDGAGKIHVRVVVQDRLAIEGGGRASPAWGVEVDELEGYDKDARQARAVLASLGLKARPIGLLDLIADRAHVDLRGYDGSPSVALSREEPAGDGFRRVLVRLADTIDANWDGTVHALDPEFLHDLRVAVRRTRSVLAQAKGVVPSAERARFREEFGWLGSVTGPARDLDVYVTEWDGYVASLGPETAGQLEPVLAHIAGRRREEHAALAATLTSDRYRRVQAAWRAWLDPEGEEPGQQAPSAARPLGSVVALRVAAAQEQVVMRGRSIGPDSPATDLHELRKDAKKLRYLLECFGGVLAGAPRKAFVQQLKALQDNLGEHQDTEVHSDRLREISRELHREPGVTAETLLAMGRLTEHFEQRRQAARDEFAQRFAAYDTKRTRRNLDDLIGSATGR